MKLQSLLNSIVEYEDDIDGAVIGLASLSDGLKNIDVDSVVNDHNLVNESSIFVAIRGTSIDSHAYIPDARQRHCAFVVAQRGSKTEMEPDMTVGSTRAIVGPLQSALLGMPSNKMNLAGITGTNGKTSVSYLFSSLVQSCNENCFTMGTTGILVNGEKETDSQTTPDPLIIQDYLLRFLQDQVKYGAIEVSSHALDQYRVLGTKFKAVAFTNFSQDHLDYHSSMEEYFLAKSKLFSKKYSNNAVINIDDEKGSEILSIATKNLLNTLSVSCKDLNADIFVKIKNESLDGTDIEIFFNQTQDSFDIFTPFIGRFNIENIAVAIGLAEFCNLDRDKYIAALSNPIPVPGRLQKAESKNLGFHCFIDYAHTPDALERVINTIKPLSKKVIVVFGCGGDRDKNKRPIMGKIASSMADEVIVTNDNPRSENGKDIAEQIISGVTKNVQVCLDRKQAIKTALSLAQKGDAVIIAGKGHERGQIFSDKTVDFSDIETTDELIEEMINNDI
ncbi:MAG: UDP-N-acetylmuramoyl-L-alanyl-D-glutamate--2,6-diaminopimelate ligase [Acidimicrobiia bacterium]